MVEQGGNGAGASGETEEEREEEEGGRRRRINIPPALRERVGLGSVEGHTKRADGNGKPFTSTKHLIDLPKLLVRSHAKHITCEHLACSRFSVANVYDASGEQ